MASAGSTPCVSVTILPGFTGTGPSPLSSSARSDKSDSSDCSESTSSSSESSPESPPESSSESSSRRSSSLLASGASVILEGGPVACPTTVTVGTMKTCTSSSSFTPCPNQRANAFDRRLLEFPSTLCRLYICFVRGAMSAGIMILLRRNANASKALVYVAKDRSRLPGPWREMAYFQTISNDVGWGGKSCEICPSRFASYLCIFFSWARPKN